MLYLLLFEQYLLKATVHSHLGELLSLFKIKTIYRWPVLNLQKKHRGQSPIDRVGKSERIERQTNTLLTLVFSLKLFGKQEKYRVTLAFKVIYTGFLRPQQNILYRGTSLNMFTPTPSLRFNIPTNGGPLSANYLPWSLPSLLFISFWQRFNKRCVRKGVVGHSYLVNCVQNSA